MRGAHTGADVIKLPLQGCALMSRLGMAADGCCFFDDQRLSCVYNVLVAPCHPQHFEMLSGAVLVHMQRRKDQFYEYFNDRQHPDVQLSLKDVVS